MSCHRISSTLNSNIGTQSFCFNTDCHNAYVTYLSVIIGLVPSDNKIFNFLLFEIVTENQLYQGAGPILTPGI
jgi:hypothetical protein